MNEASFELMSKSEYERATAASRPARMAWWKQARFGMFVHWGLYALLGRNEWAMAFECIPKEEYEKLADQFVPEPGAAAKWARLAKQAGMKYMVFTTKHHEGFCLWDTQQTDYNAVKSACGRDLVAEYVQACRAEGLKVGFYYSLMDWHHPDGARAAYDPAARERFLNFTRGCLRELLTQYGKIDILWYDAACPFQTSEGWASTLINQEVRALQPDILINNRLKLAEDFATPEGAVKAAEPGREWEACMTMNDTSWGYMPSAAPETHSARAIIRMLNRTCGGRGNLLLNIGPAPDGSVPEEVIEPLRTVGKWLEQNGEAVYGDLDSGLGWGATCCGGFSYKRNICYFWCRSWPGTEIPIGCFTTELKSATLLATGQPLDFEQREYRIILKNLPAVSPDKIAGYTIIALEFASPPEAKLYATTAPMLMALKG